MLEIKNLYASVSKKKILNGLNLSIKKGELHAIMGPNGSGKHYVGRSEFAVRCLRKIHIWLTNISVKDPWKAVMEPGLLGKAKRYLIRICCMIK